MNILPINTSLNNKTFNGLWGKTINNDHTESEHYIEENIYQYYPFKDETPEQIKKVVNEKHYYKEDVPGKGTVASPWTHIASGVVSVMAALPFTSKEFMNYSLNKLSIIKQRLIERHITSKGLTLLRK